MADEPAREPAAVGLAFAAVAVTIWAGWFSVTAAGVRSTLAPVDLALIRVTVPTLLLLGVLWRQRAVVRRTGVRDGLLLSLYGVPFTLLVAAGLAHAPISHAAALIPGLMPVFTGAIGILLLGERATARRLLGFALMLSAAGLVAWQAGVFSGSFDDMARGHAFFLGACIAWTVFTLTARRVGLDPFLATALVGLYSMLALLPPYLALGLGRLATAPLGDVAVQVIAQGLLAGLVAIYAYAQAIRRLGASQAAAAAALVPGSATLIGWLLGERRPPSKVWRWRSSVSASFSPAAPASARPLSNAAERTSSPAIPVARSPD
ncbi:MAG: DMT family transporter [Pseudomonadota bacterium]